MLSWLRKNFSFVNYQVFKYHYRLGYYYIVLFWKRNIGLIFNWLLFLGLLVRCALFQVVRGEWIYSLMAWFVGFSRAEWLDRLLLCLCIFPSSSVEESSTPLKAKAQNRKKGKRMAWEPSGSKHFNLATTGFIKVHSLWWWFSNKSSWSWSWTKATFHC